MPILTVGVGAKGDGLKRRMILMVAVLAVACGIQEAKYVSYEEDVASDGGGGTLNCTEAQTAFTEIATAIDASCSASGCHGGGSGNLTLTKGEGDQNRQRLQGTSLGADAAKLFAKLSPGTTHSGGGDFGFTEEIFSGWLAAEAACPADDS